MLAEATGSDLLEAIRRDPGDDAARAVYADWLSEHGDPRGEFITLQLARTRGTPTAKAARREAALLRKHVRRWIGTLAQVAQVAGGVSLGSEPSAGRARFDRGFLVECSLHGTPPVLLAIAGHPDLATVERLVLGGSEDVVRAILDHDVMRALVAVTVGEHVEAVLASQVATRLESLAMGSRGRQGFDAINATLPDRAPRLRAVRMSLHESIPVPPAYVWNIAAQRAFAAAIIAAASHPAMREPRSPRLRHRRRARAC